MGQHKYNKNAQDAKNGLLPPKPKRLSKAQTELALYRMINAKIAETLRGAKYLDYVRSGGIK